MSKCLHDLHEKYTARARLFSSAAKRMQNILESAVKMIEDKTLVRAEVRPIRIKELASLKQKAVKMGWDSDQALTCCGDIIGGRVVCNNIEDVYRFSELLKECIPMDLFQGVGYSVQDYVTEPQATGYRALHVNFRLALGTHIRTFVPCEVQIQSCLQHAWAHLSHNDIYKQPNLPEDLRARVTDLAELLAAADKIASAIRIRVKRKTGYSETTRDLGRVSLQGLAFVFREVFGRSPSDYTVRMALNLCRNLNITTLEKLRDVLDRQSFRERAEEAHGSVLGIGIDNEDVFLASLYAVARGDEKAIMWVRKEAHRSLEKIEQFAKREMLSSLPSGIEDLIERIESSSGINHIEEWAFALGAVNYCAICGDTIVDSYSFAENAVQHYDVSEAEIDDAHERIEAAIESSGVETGGWGSGSLCSYHNHQAEEDN